MLEKHRKAILEQLMKGPRTPTNLASEIHLSRKATSKHLGILQQANLVRKEAEAETLLVAYRLTDKGTATTIQYGF